MTATNITHSTPKSNAKAFPLRASPEARRKAGFLKDLAVKWLRPDQGAPLRVIRRGRLPLNHRRYIEVETLSAGKPCALFFFESNRIAGHPWAVVPDSI